MIFASLGLHHFCSVLPFTSCFQVLNYVCQPCYQDGIGPGPQYRQIKLRTRRLLNRFLWRQALHFRGRFVAHVEIKSDIVSLKVSITRITYTCRILVTTAVSWHWGTFLSNCSCRPEFWGELWFVWRTIPENYVNQPMGLVSLQFIRFIRCKCSNSNNASKTKTFVFSNMYLLKFLG